MDLQSTVDEHKTDNISPTSVFDLLYKRPKLCLFLLLIIPIVWLCVIYIIPLINLLLQCIYTFDDFTMLVSHELTFDNFKNLTIPSNLDILIRTVVMAISVSVFSIIFSFPIAYYMARYTKGYLKSFLYIAILLPMWTSYIVKAYAWTLVLSRDGIIIWIFNHLGLGGYFSELIQLPYIGGTSLSTSNLGRFLVFCYMWMPYMILPIQAALERLPASILNASADLGASPFQTFKFIILPLTIPGIAAGSIFTFCLTLGDYIIPQLIGPPGLFLGNMVYLQQGSIGNMPMAATFSLVPIVLISIYLRLAKHWGAFDAL